MIMMLLSFRFTCLNYWFQNFETNTVVICSRGSSVPVSAI